jgi:hypothetical protein
MAVLMNPYAYRDAGQLAFLNLRDKAGNDRRAGLSAFQIRRVRQLDSIESVLAMNEWNLTTTDGDRPEDVVAWYLTPNGMAHLGVAPLLGPGLITSDAPGGRIHNGSGPRPKFLAEALCRPPWHYRPTSPACLQNVHNCRRHAAAVHLRHSGGLLFSISERDFVLK